MWRNESVWIGFAQQLFCRGSWLLFSFNTEWWPSSQAIEASACLFHDLFSLIWLFAAEFLTFPKFMFYCAVGCSTCSLLFLLWLLELAVWLLCSRAIQNLGSDKLSAFIPLILSLMNASLVRKSSFSFPLTNHFECRCLAWVGASSTNSHFVLLFSLVWQLQRTWSRSFEPHLGSLGLQIWEKEYFSRQIGVMFHHFCTVVQESSKQCQTVVEMRRVVLTSSLFSTLFNRGNSKIVWFPVTAVIIYPKNDIQLLMSSYPTVSISSVGSIVTLGNGQWVIMISIDTFLTNCSLPNDTLIQEDVIRKQIDWIAHERYSFKSATIKAHIGNKKYAIFENAGFFLPGMWWHPFLWESSNVRQFKWKRTLCLFFGF